MKSKSVLRFQSRFFSFLVIASMIFQAVGVTTPVQAAGLVLYAKPTASGTGDCSSWVDACTLQDALTTAVSGAEIWVAAGTHMPTSGTDRTISFWMPAGVGIYGGFAGTETERNQRDFEINVTTLSGDIGTPGDNSDNSGHVVVADAIDNTAVLDGFTITKGNASAGGPFVYGGGIWANDCSPTIRNIILSDNSAQNGGGGLATFYCSPNLINVSFENNLASGGMGGGMFSNQTSAPSLTNVTFNNNSASSGGGLFLNYDSDAILDGVVFSGNTATDGGGMYKASTSNPTLTNVIFSDNSAIFNGGGMHNDGDSLALTDVTFSNNSANCGGGMFNESSNPTIMNTTFSDNLANLGTCGGGGMFNHQSSPTLTNATFSGNSATLYGGGLYNGSSSDPTLTNVTFSGNSATDNGGGIYNYDSNPAIHNTILWGNTAPSGAQIYEDGTSTATVNEGVLEGGCPAGSTCTNIITTDPYLDTLASNGGFTQTMALGTGSSAMEAGDDATCAATDQRGIARPQGAHCDIGAYEYEYSAKVGMITDVAGIADQGINYMAYQGLLQAEADLGIDGTLYEPANESEYSSKLQQCADEGNGLCIGSNWVFYSVVEAVAAANPTVDFAVLDSSYDAPPANLRGILFNERESGYLAGALAGKMTATDTAGVVAGMEIRPVVEFAEGFRNGALCANPNMNVLINYTGTFTDPSLGATTAQDMMTQGADVIFNVAGPTGEGAILYGAQNDAWSIGVDTDQYLTTFGNGSVSGSDKMLTSAMKRFDTAVYGTVADYLWGDFTSGTVQYNLIDNGVGLAPYHETDASIPQLTKDYVDAVKADIISGVVDPHDTCRSTISGTVHDADGNPFGASVRAVLTSDGTEVARTTSYWLDGSYTLIGLPLDTELAIVASDEDPDTDGYPADYYNNVEILDWAETIALTSGSPNRSGVNFALTNNGAGLEHFAFNVRAGRILTDLEIRKAIAYGTNRQALLDNAFEPNGETGEVLHSMVDPAAWYAAAPADLTVYNFNKSQAETILTDAGWTDTDADGIRENSSGDELALVFITTSAQRRVDSGNLFKAQMAEIGIKVNLQFYNAGDFFSGDPARSPLASGDFDIAEFAWGLVGVFDNLATMYNTTDPQNFGGYSNPALDGIYEDARLAKVTGDLPSFEANALLWQQTFANDLPDLPLFTRTPLNALVAYDCNYGGLLKSVVANDPDTVTFNLCRPDSAFLHRVAMPTFAIYPEQWIQDTSGPEFRTTEGLESPVGTGPYKVGAWDRGNSLSLVINPDYWGAAPEADTLTYTWNGDPAARLTELQDGNIDGFDAVGTGDYGTVETDSSLQLLQRPTINTFYMGMNHNVAPFDDVRVRKAVALALDRQQIIDILYPMGNAEVPTHFTPCVIPNGCVGTDWYDQDVTTAQSLLSDAGYPTGFNINLYYSASRQVMAEEIRDQLLANLGINVTLVIWDASIRQQIQAGNGDGLFIWGWSADYAHVSNFLDPFFGSDSGTGFDSGFNHVFGDSYPDIYNQLDLAAQYVDPALAEPYYIAANNAIRDLVPMIPVFHVSDAVAYQADVINPQSGPMWYDIFARSDPGGRNEFKWMQANEPNSLFCADEADIDSYRACSQVLETLYTYENNGTDITPALAESCTPNADLTKWVCNLRDNVKFHDGTFLDSNDVVATFTMELDASSPTHVGRTNAWEYSFLFGLMNVGGSSGGNPSVQVRANDNQVEGSDWPVGNTVTIDISRTGESITRTAEVFGSTPWGETRPYFQYQFNGEFDILPGDVVSVTDGTTSRTITISPLAFTDVDLDTDVVTGIANPGAQVNVWVCDGPTCNWNRHTTADGSTGIWSVDFANVGTQGDEQTTVDIKPGTWIDSSEDGPEGSTMYGITIPNPYIEANVINRWVHAREWPMGTLMTMEIDDLSNGLGGMDYTRTATMNQNLGNPGDPNDILAEFDMSGFTLEAGDVITMSGEVDGVVKTKTLVVSPLAITAFDVDADTISGVASPGSDVQVCINIPNNCVSRNLVADAVDGTWTANYNPDYDLNPGDYGWTAEYDSDSDRTWYDWSIPGTPSLIARLGQDRVAANEWSDGTPLALVINDPNTTSSIDYFDDTQTAQLNNPSDPWSGTYAIFDFAATYTLKPGDEITVTGGGVTRSMIVADINITDVDIEADTVSGTAGDGIDQVSVRMWSSPFDVVVTADVVANAWVADLSGVYDLGLGDNGVARWWDVNGFMTSDYFEIPNPNFSARFPEGEVHGYQWPLGADITISIDDPDTGVGEDYTATVEAIVAPWDSNSTFAQFTLFDFAMGLQVGQVITMTDGSITKTHTVSNLAVTDVDVDTDTITGSVEPDAWVDVDANCGPGGCTYLGVNANGSGDWSADFSALTDLVPGSSGEVRAPDSDGDTTTVQWNVPNPQVQVRANDNNVEGWDWTPGATVTIDISRTGESISRTAVVGSASWDPRPYFSYNFNGEFDILPGDVVTVTEGGTSKTVTVTNLAFTNIDLDTDIVTGVSSASAFIDLWVCNDAGCNTNRRVQADGDGNWTADFAHVGVEDYEQTTVDLVPGTWIDSIESDSNGSGTMYGITIPNPFAEASLQYNWVHARGWPNGTMMTMEIDDLTNGLGSADYTRTATMGQNLGNPGDPNDILADFDMSSFTLEAGDVITISGEMDGSTRTKTLTVVNLQATSFDVDADTISGIASLSGDVEVCVNIPNNCVSRTVTADPTDGTWTVNFSPDHDLVFGDTGWVVEYDSDSDRNQYDWYLLNQFIVTIPNLDRVRARNWPDGTPLTLTIDDPSNGVSIDKTAFATASSAGWSDGNTSADFDIADFDLQTGQFLTVSGGGIERAMSPWDIAITDVDVDANTISGTSVFDYEVRAWVCYPDGTCSTRYVIPDPITHVWVADFNILGTGPDANETQIVDLVPGDSGSADQLNEGGNITRVNWDIPNPNFSARFPEGEVHGYQWPLGANVTVSIDDPDNGVGEDYSATVEAIAAPWDSSQTFAQFSLSDFAMGLQPGQLITMTDGSIIKSHTVSGLAVTGVDIDTDVITGTVEADATLDIDANCGDAGCAANLNVTANGSGDWSADFSGVDGGDLQLGSRGEVQAPDSDGDATTVQWNVPNPYIEASAQDNWVHAREWPRDTLMTLEIDDLSDGLGEEPVDFETTALMGQASWNPGDPNDIVAEFDLGGFTLEAGDVIIVSGEMNGATRIKTLVVSDLAVTNIDQAVNTVSGTSSSSGLVEVGYLCDPNGCALRRVNPTSGVWLVDFSANPGAPTAEEQYPYDIKGGDGNQALQYDSDNDLTYASWNVFYPGSVTISSGDPIEVAAALDLSMGAMTIGESGLKAIQMAVNDFGSINGFTVQLNSIDGKCQDGMDGYEAAANIIVNPQNVGVIGHTCSGGLIGALPVYESVGMVTISSSSTSTDIPGYGPHVFNRAILYDPYADPWLAAIQTLPGVIAWSTDYHTLYGEDPDPYAVLYYDAATLMLQRIKDVGTVQPDGSFVINRSELTDAVRGTTDFPGISGLLGFDSVGNRLRPIVVLGEPSGLLPNWDHTLNWTGAGGAASYYLELQTSAGDDVLSGWYTASEAVCSADLSCSLTPPELAGLPDGDYKWRIQDSGDYGVGTSTEFQSFTLNRCHTLTLGHSGIGSDPVASPANSSGCTSGTYIEGENISLSDAVPASGWMVGSWQSTNDDSSTASTNVTVMPNHDHIVNVNYVNIPPSVVSIVRFSAENTSAANLQFTVTFSETVTGVDAADFEVVETGTLSGSTVTSMIGTGVTRRVTVAVGMGSGTLGLDVNDDDSIVDGLLAPLGGEGLGNGDFTAGASYSVDRTPPSVVSIVRESGETTTATSVNFIVTWDTPAGSV
ncbi:MAG: BMP family ABC transporter substrate-binding protein [Chloroflexi bacterium]|nr:BMP family ABC transporter substrate-binding protein [Chloroflexota bacterium]